MMVVTLIGLVHSNGCSNAVSLSLHGFTRLSLLLFLGLQKLSLQHEFLEKYGDLVTKATSLVTVAIHCTKLSREETAVFGDIIKLPPSCFELYLSLNFDVISGKNYSKYVEICTFKGFDFSFRRRCITSHI